MNTTETARPSARDIDPRSLLASIHAAIARYGSAQIGFSAFVGLWPASGGRINRDDLRAEQLIGAHTLQHVYGWAAEHKLSARLIGADVLFQHADTAATDKLQDRIRELEAQLAAQQRIADALAVDHLERHK
jgi:hypothetical protein